MVFLNRFYCIRACLTRLTTVLFLSCLGSTSLVGAQSMDKPAQKVVLTVTGQIGVGNVGKEAHFDMGMLQKLPIHRFTTNTPWDKEAVTFTGFLLRDLVTTVKGTGTTVQATALNDYKVRIPLSDATTHNLIVAYAINDQPIPVRTKGPLFVVYPFDSKPELKANMYYERSIWQLKSLEFLP